jgi:hypothetical protein
VSPLVDIGRVVHGTPGLGEGVKTGGGAAITVLDEFGEVGVGRGARRRANDSR